MISPLQITFRHMKASEAVAARIRAEALKLDRYYGRITSCRVVVEAPHRHHRRGGACQIRINLGLPCEEIVIRHAPGPHKAVADTEGIKPAKRFESEVVYEDIYAGVRDAFNAARRRLEDYVRRLRGDVKIHARVLPVRAEKLRSEMLAGIGPAQDEKGMEQISVS
jgi:ribosome-associated translation inhibitor RaiA